MRILSSSFFVLLCLASTGAVSAQSVPVVYTVDTTQSLVSVSGELVGVALAQQGPGSHTTTYTGEIGAAVDSNQVQFTSSGVVRAEDSGRWAPLPSGASGTSPANYGFLVAGPIPEGIPFPSNGVPAGVTISGFRALMALRHLELSIGSELLPVDAAGQFPGTQLVVQVVTGDVALRVDAVVNVPFLGDVFFPVTNGTVSFPARALSNANADASITQSNGTETLRIAVDNLLAFTLFSTNDSFFSLQGQVVASRVLPPPPSNRPPVLAALSDVYLVAGSTSRVSLVADDPDPGQDLIFSATGDVPVLVVSNQVHVLPTPADAFRVATIQASVQDTGSPPRSDTRSFQVHVAGEPVVTQIVTRASDRGIGFQAMAGFAYELERAGGLAGNQVWTVQGSVVASNAFGWVQDLAPVDSNQFYRVRFRP